MDERKKHELDKKFEELFHTFSNEKFFNEPPIMGELPFYIFPYDPVYEEKVNDLIISLVKRLSTKGLNVSDVPLFQLCVSLLENQNLLEKVVEREPSFSKEVFLHNIQNPLNANTTIPTAIRNQIEKEIPKIIFIRETGAVFPFIRTHNLLNNLHSIPGEIPLVLFFPGRYDNVRMRLFGQMSDDNYYRAYNLQDFKL